MVCRYVLCLCAASAALFAGCSSTDGDLESDLPSASVPSETVLADESAPEAAPEGSTETPGATTSTGQAVAGEPGDRAVAAVDIGATLVDQLDWMCGVLTEQFGNRNMPIMQRLAAAEQVLDVHAAGSELEAFAESIPPGDIDDAWDRLLAHAESRGVRGFSCAAARRGFEMIARGEDDWNPTGPPMADYETMCEVAAAVLAENTAPEHQQREWSSRVSPQLASREGRALFDALAETDPDERASRLVEAAARAGTPGFDCPAFGTLSAPYGDDEVVEAVAEDVEFPNGPVEMPPIEGSGAASPLPEGIVDTLIDGEPGAQQGDILPDPGESEGAAPE